MIVSMGEALIDRVHSSGGQAFTPQVGGSPFNVAIALARLGVKTGFICPLSNDPYGRMLKQALTDADVRVLWPEAVDAPTAIADVHMSNEGAPSYSFQRVGTADRALSSWAPVGALPSPIHGLHFGSLALAQADDWPFWREAVSEARDRGAWIALDLNVRPPLIDDMASYRVRVTEAIELSNLVKASDEDLALLFPSEAPEEVALGWATDARLAVLTLGAEGAKAWLADGTCVKGSSDAAVTVVDTVGAGDTFQAAMIAWLWHHGAMGEPLSSMQVRQMLRFGCRAAALNCEQKGCQPPSLEDMT